MVSILYGKHKIITITTFLLIGTYLYNKSEAILAQKAEKIYPGTYQVIVKKVDDGDTIQVDIPAMPAIIGEAISIRLYGIDSPEIHDRRPEIKAIANKAKEMLKDTLYSAKIVSITDLRRDKYFRIDAVVIADGKNLNQMMLEAKLAKPYDGGKKSPW